ncbi:hypothetical protein Ahia01_000634400 [Argonauta hians]
MMLYFVTVYKIENTGLGNEVTEYRTSLMKRFNNQRSSNPFRYDSSMQASSPLHNIILDPQIFQIMAAMDYFLYRNHNLSLLRQGTILARYDGMHIIEVLDHFRRTLSLNIVDIICLVVNSSGSNETIRILDPL